MIKRTLTRNTGCYWCRLFCFWRCAKLESKNWPSDKAIHTITTADQSNKDHTSAQKVNRPTPNTVDHAQLCEGQHQPDDLVVRRTKWWPTSAWWPLSTVIITCMLVCDCSALFFYQYQPIFYCSRLLCSWCTFHQDDSYRNHLNKKCYQQPQVYRWHYWLPRQVWL